MHFSIPFYVTVTFSLITLLHFHISRVYKPRCLLAPSICTLADLLLLEKGTFSIRFDPLPFSAGLPRIPLDIWKTAEDKMVADGESRIKVLSAL